MLAIITGTIRPDSGMGGVALNNENERLLQYKKSMEFFIKSKAFEKIIFCENSNFGLEEFQEVKQLANQMHISLELLSFQGNLEKANLQGKGYGEGEILNYIIDNSSLIKGEDYFIKITGRLVIDNIAKIVSLVDKRNTYFNIPNLSRKEFYDTRVYGMPIDQFINCFLYSYLGVNDEKGIFLEHRYTDIISINNISIKNFPRYPRIKGISGTLGIEYTYKEWKCKIKDMISRFNAYTIRV